MGRAMTATLYRSKHLLPRATLTFSIMSAFQAGGRVDGQRAKDMQQLSLYLFVKIQLSQSLTQFLLFSCQDWVTWLPAAAIRKPGR